MSSTIESITDENVENLPPSTFQCTPNASTKETNSSKAKRNDYLKHRGRRKKWWYFNRGLQPISEVAEIKDDPSVECYPTIINEDDTIISRNESLNIKNDSLNIINSPSSENIIHKGNVPQIKEGYSPCLKVIEKFQEIVLDSAVRVIQAAFKRFRERRRFLKIKKAVLVIQRNLRKWLEAKHPCLRPAEFERQSSDGSKSDEYRESEEKNVDDIFLTNEDSSYKSHDVMQSSQVEEHAENSGEIELEINEQTPLEDISEKSCHKCNEHCTNGNEVLENKNSGEDSTEKTINTSEIEESQACELLEIDNKYTQNDISIVEGNPVSISDIKDFSECDHIIDKAQIHMGCTTDTTSYEEKEEEFELGLAVQEENNTSEKSQELDIEIEKCQVNILQNDDNVSTETAVVESIAQNSIDNENNNGLNNIEEYSYAGNDEWTKLKTNTITFMNLESKNESLLDLPDKKEEISELDSEQEI